MVFLHLLVLKVLNLVKKNIKSIKEINNEQLGSLERTYLINRFGIRRADKGSLFVLRKINSPTLFKNLKEIIKIFKNIN